MNIQQYITDKEGHKISAIIDIEELNRLDELIEDLSDLKAIDERIDEPVEDFKTYIKNRKTSLSV
ncbi:MAG: hypothetical protein HQK91_04600 [Nitrospirae bacterium]|nr:hypothetical protein [Nitrospirota bacterium]MBF0540713.1 hypothetical protein [Nitrospirota bacterium]